MITKSVFGTDKNGNVVTNYRIENGDLTAEILDRGATIKSLSYQGIDVALGYDSVAGYEENGGYLGATIGRYGNRIAEGKFCWNGKEYQVDCNERGKQHLHGGNIGYDKLIWKEQRLEENALTLSLTDDGTGAGYPGVLQVKVRFLVEKDTLLIEYSAIGDKDTPINLTNHSYFNLSGAGNGDILDTQLQISASHYLPVDENLIPTGVLAKTSGTAFDFTKAKSIGRDIKIEDVQLALGGGYDHNFCLDGEGYRTAIKAYSPKSKIIMCCLTDQPGVQLYTGNVLSTSQGKGTENGYEKHGGFCLETQHYPDSPNQAAFPSTILKAGQTYNSKTAYAFSKE